MDTPLLIADAVPIAGENAAPVQTEAVVNWLVEKGFTPVEWGDGRVLKRGCVRSIFGPEQDIIAHVNEEAGEVCDLYVRFTLPRPSPPPLAAWAVFAADLCERFALRLAPDGVDPCSEVEFLAAVRGDHFYQKFAATFGWCSLDVEPSSGPPT